MLFYSVASFFALSIPFGLVGLGLVMFPETMKFKILNWLIAVVLVVASLPISQALASWRIDRSLESIFQSNVRYAVTDYRRTLIEDISVHSVSADVLGFVSDGKDGCVEARINLPDGLNMTGFRWYMQNYRYDESNGTLLDIFNARKFWIGGPIIEGRC